MGRAEQLAVTEQTAQVLGMATRISAPRPERAIRPLDTNLEGESAIFVQRTLRSGFKVSHHGHVIVVGDVNPGAEVIAGGSIVIWGRLRGSFTQGQRGTTRWLRARPDAHAAAHRGSRIHPTHAQGQARTRAGPHPPGAGCGRTLEPEEVTGKVPALQWGHHPAREALK